VVKTVFRPGEVEIGDTRVVLEAPFHEEVKVVDAGSAADVDVAEVFEGPTADELRTEAEAFKVQWAAEKAAMLHAAKSEAELITNDARYRSEERLKDLAAEVAAKLEAAEGDARRVREAAEAEAASIKNLATAAGGEIKARAEREGFEKGRAEGFEAGKGEVNRLVLRTQVILERIQDKRDDIFSEAEQQIVDLVLLIARKVVKTIAEAQGNVVVENIRDALNKAKSRGTVRVRVNLADLDLSTEHLEEFVALIEGGGTVQILEDSSVDRGGCVVETDFGEIDARIASQFAKLEERLLSVSPQGR
jgi:flagellar assembly protein FliH